MGMMTSCHVPSPGSKEMEICPPQKRCLLQHKDIQNGQHVDGGGILLKIYIAFHNLGGH